MIHVTEKAADKIRQLLTKEGVPEATGGLRVGVQGGRLLGFDVCYAVGYAGPRPRQNI